MMETRKMIRVAIFIAMSAVGGFIKIPSPTMTVAFDSLPGYLAAALFGGWQGALVGALGHIFSAWTVSFPLSIPMHVFIAVQMAFFCWTFGFIFNKGHKTVAIVVATLLNGVAAPAMLIPILGKGIFAALLLPLLVGSAVNILLAAVLAQSKAIQKAGKEFGI
jgi:uncharacterized membrane protein